MATHIVVVLRGGSHGPNYNAENVTYARKQLEAAKLTPAIMTDCSHANSCKILTASQRSLST